MNRARLLLSCALFAALLSSSCTNHAPPPKSAALSPDPSSGKKGAQKASATAAKAEPTAAAAPLGPPPAPEPLAPPEDDRWVSPSAPSHASPVVPDGRGGESFGAGGLGLSGIGEGGGGRSEGIGLGSVGTVGHGAGTGSASGFGSGHGRLGAAGPTLRMGSTSVSGSASSGAIGRASGAAVAPSAAVAPGQQDVSVKTGEWDDNANFREYSRWLGSERWQDITRFDQRSRRFIVVRDAAGKAVPSCAVQVKNGSGRSLDMLTTSSGRAILFPAAEDLGNGALEATARCQGAVVTQQLTAGPGDGVVEIKLPVDRVLPAAQTIDIAFILDTTGSMAEEIDALRDTIQKVADQVKTLNVHVRVGLVEFKDRGDEYVTRTHAMTTDIDGIQARIAGIRAAGGGDTPEHVNQALRAAVQRLKWKSESIARLAFLIGDAPPHLDYQGDEGYAGAVREANHEGIQVYTIAASGMDPIGQVVWRQIAQYTGATHMFVLRGGAGPQSTGGGDPRDSCGGTHTDYRSGALDQLILSKIRGAIIARDADPMRIAGLTRDEKDKPCDQRVGMVQ